MTAYGYTLTISSSTNSTDLDSETFTENFDGHSCKSSVECAENLECRESICQCSESKYWDISKCYTNICAVEQCMNGEKCQMTGNRHRCECVDGYLGDKCQYAGKFSFLSFNCSNILQMEKKKDFIVIFHEAYGSPSPRILPAVNRKWKLSVFYFANNKNVSVPLNSVNNQYILDSNVLMTNGLHQV
ncbi:unnamed protein product [Mytilus coruscus]|uniref:EGF-like domain-containing protein n=1 Tax=Mytilus coruscus TaxID=42192 RepID=A0A6J8APY8_MYTCO|nr:unnamed protein product [Mytilus coruscus]